MRAGHTMGGAGLTWVTGEVEKSQSQPIRNKQNNDDETEKKKEKKDTELRARPERECGVGDRW